MRRGSTALPPLLAAAISETLTENSTSFGRPSSSTATVLDSGFSALAIGVAARSMRRRSGSR